MKLRFGLLVFFGAYFLFFCGDNLYAPRWWDWRALELHGVSAAAQVKSVERSNHNICAYSFRVDGIEYAGRQSGCGQNPVGSSIEVIYLPSNPGMHTIDDPSENWLIPMIAYAFFSLITAIGAGYNYDGPSTFVRWIKAIASQVPRR